MGHCLLVGDSGTGKTVLSKFVSWMNGLSIFQIKAHSRYSLEDFNEDLRSIMRRVGIDGEKICFIFDESNALGSGFLEAMNALLASGEVPGLFDGDEYTSLINAFREACSRNGLIIDNEEELWRRFASVVQRNLHVVFTMNPSGGEWKSRSTTSPALFNRCVVDWFGTWSAKAMGEVGREFTSKIDLSDAESVGGSWGIGDGKLIMDKVSEAFEGYVSCGLHQAVVAALVEIHETAKHIADECANSSSIVTRTYLSPRDFLSLIHNFITCTKKIREQVEDEQLHVNAGLEKLRQTQENVAELKVALSAKTVELRRKEDLANEKLQQMVTDQQEAEKRKEEVERTSREVEKQSLEISKRKDEAQKELDEAEPALLSAKSAVEGIKKTDLDFVRNLPRPTINVQLTLECVAILLGESNLDWSNVRKMLGKIDFISNILNFNASDVTPRQVKILQEKYFEGNEDLNYEVVMRASKACGPLYKWAESQIKYSLVYNRVQPLREEVEKLEIDAESAVAHQHVIEEEISKLEESIDNYKRDYALLIRDVESLKREMELVTEKVSRAESLILSLSKESKRWSKSSQGFQVILRNLVGDGLLMAAFLTYSGFFDFRARVQLSKRWQDVLDSLGIEYRETLSMIDILSKHSDRIHWQSLGLPPDNLSLENGVILDNFVRFPLIIDPSGQAIEFVMNKFKNEKIQKTSFLDNAFTKTLAGAIRFGTTLLVENVEHIDPILNPVLNKEIQRTGGRSLVRIGTEEVDYSPNFKIILTTKNPAARLSPDICSRVTLINFTVTPASLQSQSLSLVLRKEKPNVEEERISVSKLQGEQLVRLRELEEKMLATLSAAEGSVLDDDRVVKGMEFLMKEGNQIEKQIANSSNVIKEVERVMNEFEPYANLCRDIFVLLLSLRELNFLYEFSSESFMQIIESSLSHRTTSISDPERISVLRQSLFFEVAARIGRSLSSTDKMVFALLLTNLLGTKMILSGENLTIEDISEFIQKAFGTDFPWQGRGLDDLHYVLDNEIDCTHPLLVCSAPGHDISDRVDVLARDMKKELFSIAMGSSEGFVVAERYVMTASKHGSWVLLRNCHLCTDWLQDTLVKKLQGISSSCHPDFRLIITSEINPHLPTSLLRMSDVIVAEAPSGVKASLTRFMSIISPDRLGDPIRNRLFLLLGWIHAVIQERLLYIPTGWLEAYEFTESDAIHAVSVLDSHINLALAGKHTIDPDKLPWGAFQTSLSKDIFGGRITKDRDQQILDQLISSLFIPSCFDINFKLADVDGAPCLPDGASRSECLAWIQSLPSYTPPTWIGLDVSDETLRSKAIVETVLGRVEKIQNIMDHK
jgi:dynein heavy chain 1, cytosolic